MHEADTTEKPELEELILDPQFQRTVDNIAYGFLLKYSAGGTNPMIDRNDLISEGIIAATTAYHNFDPSRKTSFKTYAYPYIRHAMDSYCRRYAHSLTISEKESRDRFVDLMDTSVLRIHQDSESEDDEFDIPTASGIMYHCDVDEYFFSGFTPFERKLAEDKILNGLTVTELSKKYNTSRSRISAIIKNLKARMKDKAQRYVEED